MQMIFQDPAESLNPRHTVRDIVGEPFIVQKLGTKDERRACAPQARSSLKKELTIVANAQQ